MMNSFNINVDDVYISVKECIGNMHIPPCFLKFKECFDCCRYHIVVVILLPKWKEGSRATLQGKLQLVLTIRIEGVWDGK